MWVIWGSYGGHMESKRGHMGEFGVIKGPYKGHIGSYKGHIRARAHKTLNHHFHRLVWSVFDRSGCKFLVST